MLQCETIGTSEEIGIDKTEKSKKSVITTISTTVLSLIEKFAMIVIEE